MNSVELKQAVVRKFTNSTFNKNGEQMLEVLFNYLSHVKAKLREEIIAVNMRMSIILIEDHPTYRFKEMEYMEAKKYREGFEVQLCETLKYLLEIEQKSPIGEEPSDDLLNFVLNLSIN